MKNKKSKSLTHLNRLAVVLNDSNDAITVQDLDGNIKAWNKGAEKIYGYNEDEALAMNIMEIAPPEKQKEVTEYLMLIKSGQKIESFETQRITKNGSTLDILLVATCLKNESGIIDAIATTEKDITEIKNALREKEEEVKKLKSLLPICAVCKQIRDDEGYWHQIEQYIETHTDSKFSHGLCPKCERELYGSQKWYKKRNKI